MSNENEFSNNAPLPEESTDSKTVLSDVNEQTPEEVLPEEQAQAPAPAAEEAEPEQASPAAQAVPQPQAEQNKLLDEDLFTHLFDAKAEPTASAHTSEEASAQTPSSMVLSKLRQFFSSLFHNKKLMRSSACLLLICALIYFLQFDGRNILDHAIRFVRYINDDTEYSFDAHNSNCYASFRDGIAVASVNNLLCLDRKGKEIALIQNHADPPSLLQNGSAVLSFGVGGSTISVYRSRKNSSDSIEIPGTLIDASLSSDSCICYSSVQSGYKAVLTAIDNSGESFYSWYSSTQFFSQCAVNSKAKNIAAIALGQNGESFESSCVIFETDKEEPIATVSLGSDVIYALRFVSDKKLCAVGETALYFFNLDGSDYSEYKFSGSDLLFYNLDSTGFQAIVRDLNEAGSRFQIATIDNNGKEIAHATFDEAILDISTNNRYLAVLTSDCVLVYDRHLHLCLREDHIGFATHICVQKDGSVLLIDGSSARRIR